MASLIKVYLVILRIINTKILSIGQPYNNCSQTVRKYGLYGNDCKNATISNPYLLQQSS